MPTVVVTGSAEDSVRWEEGFRNHGDLFQSQGVRSPIRFATADGNRIAAIFEVDDLERYFEVFESPETSAAMAEDGFMRETAEVFTVDKEFHF